MSANIRTVQRGAGRTRRIAESAATAVDVVLPVYNGARFLEATLASIESQTLTPSEIIVVDDGSTDDSTEVIRTSPLADRITLLHQENAGQSAARNAGVEQCNAPLVAFLDQDDIWHPDHLSRLVEPFDDDEVGWAYSDFTEIDEEGRLVIVRFHRTHGVAHPKESLAEMIGEDLMVLPSAMIARRSALVEVGGFDERLCGYEDDDLCIRLFRHHWRPAYLDRSTVSFRIHSGSSSVSPTFARSRLIFLDKLVEQIPNSRRLNRYYVRDLVVPRLLRTTLGEYVTCLMHDDLDGAAVAAATASAVAARARLTSKRRLALWVLRHPAACRRMLAARSTLPQPLRRRVLRAVSYNTDVGKSPTPPASAPS